MKFGFESSQSTQTQEVPKEAAPLSPEQIEHGNHILEVYDEFQKDLILRFISRTPDADTRGEIVTKWIVDLGYAKKFSEIVDREGELINRFMKTRDGSPEREAILQEVESKLY